MVRREANDRWSRSGRSARCTSPTGASPVPVSAGAPGSRPQARRETFVTRAGRQEPVRWQEPFSGEQARGPQHEVKPAASTDKQSGSRAAHVTAKATLGAPRPEGAPSPGGVGGAARVQGEVRNTGDPSALPSSRQGGSYKPEAKSSVAQRESEGAVVPVRDVKNNASLGKGPCFGHARRKAKCEGMDGRTVPNHPRARQRADKAREPGRELYATPSVDGERRHRA